jgi:hypothetical protein
MERNPDDERGAPPWDTLGIGLDVAAMSFDDFFDDQ